MQARAASSAASEGPGPALVAASRPFSPSTPAFCVRFRLIESWGRDRRVSDYCPACVSGRGCARVCLAELIDQATDHWLVEGVDRVMRV